MKKLTKLLSIMLLTSITCGTMLSDVQFGQKFTNIDDAKTAGFIPLSDYLKGFGKDPRQISHWGFYVIPEAVGHAIIIPDSSFPFRVMAVLTPDFTKFVRMWSGNQPRSITPTPLNLFESTDPSSVYGKDLMYKVYNTFYIHPTVTFPDIIKPFQS